MTGKKLRRRIKMCAKVPFTIDIDDVGPFIRGYVEAMLDTSYAENFWGRVPLGWHGIRDIEEATIAQMMRDALYFYGRHSKFVNDKDKNPSQYIAGRRLWLCRVGKLRGNKGWYKRVRVGHWQPKFALTADDKVMQIGPLDLGMRVADVLNQVERIEWV